MDPKTVFIIAVTTAKMIMPGMPTMDIPGMKDLNAPTRTMTMNLTNDKAATEKFKAECAIPECLKLGPKVDLAIDLPQKSEDDGKETDQKQTPGEHEFKLNTYWGCSEVVLQGQPKVIDSKEISKVMRDSLNKKNVKNLNRYLGEDGTHAYWPGRETVKIAKDAKCPGDYKLTTNFCGGTAITFDTPQDWLAPIDLVSPGKNVDLAKFIKVEWKAVPNAVAYMLTAFGGNEKEMTTWTSCSSPNAPADVQVDEALSKPKVEKYIKDGVLLPADATSCCIPAGIFKEIGQPMLSVVAFGADRKQDKDDIVTHVVIRSKATVMLGAMGGFEDEQPKEDRKLKKKPADEDDDTPPAVEETEEPSGDSNGGNVIDEADNASDKVGKVKNTLKRVKDIFK